MSKIIGFSETSFLSKTGRHFEPCLESIWCLRGYNVCSYCSLPRYFLSRQYLTDHHCLWKTEYVCVEARKLFSCMLTCMVKLPWGFFPCIPPHVSLSLCVLLFFASSPNTFVLSKHVVLLSSQQRLFLSLFRNNLHRPIIYSLICSVSVSLLATFSCKLKGLAA